MVDRICKDGAGEKSIVKGLDSYMFTLASRDKKYTSKKYLEENASVYAFNSLYLQKF